MSACGVVAEAEVFAFVDFDGVERVAEDCVGELAGGPVAELVGEGKDEGGSRPVAARSSSFCGSGVMRRRRRVGAEDAGGVGSKVTATERAR